MLTVMCEERRDSKGFEPLIVTEDFELPSEGNGVPTVLLKTKPEKEKGSLNGQDNEDICTSASSTAEESEEDEEKGDDDDDVEEEEGGESSETQLGSTSSSSSSSSSTSVTELSLTGASDVNLIGSGSLKLCIKEQKKDVKLTAVIGEEKGRQLELKESPLCKSLQKMASVDFKNLSKLTY